MVLASLLVSGFDELVDEFGEEDVSDSEPDLRRGGASRMSRWDAGAGVTD